ncbi:MAG: hypothetical protein ACREGF_06490 [Candidatus Saccharimonadales bacterium]
MNKVATIDLKGKEYALVPERLKAFREANPRASVDTNPTIQDGTVIFKAHIVMDKKNPDSPEATGHSYGKFGSDKAFEKLETVAVGRALALLGYLNNGQIATTEDMTGFEDYRQEQYELAIAEIQSAIKKEEFTAILSKLSPDQKQDATPIINLRIKELKDGKSS